MTTVLPNTVMNASTTPFHQPNGTQSLASETVAAGPVTVTVDVMTKEEDDPWSLTLEVESTKSWSALSAFGKLKRVITGVLRVVLVFGLLYMFVCSLDFLSSAFRLLGGKAAGKALADVELLANPIAGVMIGVIATILVQSSSTSTSVVVSMVSADLLTVRLAIPIIMGANIGTTITNVFVSLSQANDRTVFRRAFAAANIHDMFNWLTMIVFLPLEVASGYLYRLSGILVANIKSDPDMKNPDMLKTITKPFTKKIIQLDTNVITEIAKGDNVTDSLIRFCCKKSQIENDTLTTSTAMAGDNNVSLVDNVKYTCVQKCGHLFSETDMNDTSVGLIILFVALVTLCVCLVLIVKLLHSLLRGSIASIIKRVVNADFPGYARFFTGYFAILVGAGLTFLVQSSSIFTSTLTPLVGVGIIHIERVFPLALGANIGTTGTSILAALASDSAGFKNSLRIAFCHLIFNISGVLLWYTIPFMRKVPIGIAKTLGGIVAEYRWFAIVYVIFVFVLLPISVFGLSVAGWEILIGIGCPILAIVIFVIVMNVIQRKVHTHLPKRFRTWENMGLPVWLRSLQPYDKKIINMHNRFRKLVKKKDNDTEIKKDSEMFEQTLGLDNEAFKWETHL